MDLSKNVCQVYSSKTFEKQLRKLPGQIKAAIAIWIESVEEDGLQEVRKLKGYHDEPLKGDRKGQRSVRLIDLTDSFILRTSLVK